MKVRKPLSLALAATLAACGSARAGGFDPASDVDCSILSFYFDGLARFEHAPGDQQRAIDDVFAYYSARLRVQAPGRWKAKGAMEAEVGPRLEAVKADPAAAAEAMRGCSARATADRDFRRAVKESRREERRLRAAAAG